MSSAQDDVLEWLLGEDNPSVRYFTLRDILKRPSGDPEALSARKNIMLTGTVPRILEKMGEESYRERHPRFYTDKYAGLSWQVLILAELGAECTGVVARACDYILEHSWDRTSGGFSMQTSAKSGEGLPSMVIPCLTGNMVFSLIRLGHIDDPRVQDAIRWMAKYQRFDDGDGDAPSGGPYDRLTACWGKHSCHMGVVKVLKALAEVPPESRSPEVRRTISDGVEYVLKHRIYKKSHDIGSVSKPGWLKFGFPLMYQTDALEVLGILLKLGYKDSRMQDAVDLIKAKRGPSGRWAMENTFNGKFLLGIEGKGSSKWITLRALKALRAVAEV